MWAGRNYWFKLLSAGFDSIAESEINMPTDKLDKVAGCLFDLVDKTVRVNMILVVILVISSLLELMRSKIKIVWGKGWNHV